MPLIMGILKATPVQENKGFSQFLKAIKKKRIFDKGFTIPNGFTIPKWIPMKK